MHTSKKKLKHTPHIVRGESGKYYATTWGNPQITKQQTELHNKAMNFCFILNAKAYF